jgi:tripartite-type tricarboxylate transporter receptor subunit TctC
VGNHAGAGGNVGMGSSHQGLCTGHHRSTSPIALVVNPFIPASNVRELIALVMANPGRYSYASPGAGNSLHLAGEMFRITQGLDLVHVPFDGRPPR